MSEAEPGRRELVRKVLLVDEEEAFRQAVERAAKVLKLDQAGRIHPQMDLTNLGVKQKAELLLLGRYLAHAGGIADQNAVEAEEIAKHFGVKLIEVQKRLHDLKKAGKVISTDEGGYQLTEGRLPEVLSDLGVE
jgi:biotin operon repressor